MTGPLVGSTNTDRWVGAAPVLARRVVSGLGGVSVDPVMGRDNALDGRPLRHGCVVTATPAGAAMLVDVPGTVNALESAVPRFFGPDTPVSARSRLGRQARCSRSRRSRVTPPRQKPRRGPLFLNNRYHDPITGQFISVDPLVTTTGQPYVYGSANPVMFADPSGLCPISGPGSAEACWAFAAVDYTTTVHLTDETLTVITSGRPTVHYEREELSNSREGGLDPLGAIGGIVDDAVGGLEQIVDPLTCGLKGINTVTKKMGNCTAEQVERQEQYKDTGEAVCEASRAPVVGSALPDESFSDWVGGFVTTQWTQLLLSTAREGGIQAAGAVRSGLTVSGRVATAVDAMCRWGAP